MKRIALFILFLFMAVTLTAQPYQKNAITTNQPVAMTNVVLSMFTDFLSGGLTTSELTISGPFYTGITNAPGLGTDLQGLLISVPGSTYTNLSEGANSNYFKGNLGVGGTTTLGTVSGTTLTATTIHSAGAGNTNHTAYWDGNGNLTNNPAIGAWPSVQGAGQDLFTAGDTTDKLVIFGVNSNNNPIVWGINSTDTGQHVSALSVSDDGTAWTLSGATLAGTLLGNATTATSSVNSTNNYGNSATATLATNLVAGTVMNAVNAGAVTNLALTNINWSGLSTAAFTNYVAARVPIVIGAVTYYLTLSTNVP